MSAEAHSKPDLDWHLPRWIAHRGAGKLAPENTLAAFRLGASYGYRAFECDVKLSADDLPFLLHDPTLERTTSGTGVASERDWAHLSCLDAGGWHSRSFAGECLPCLAAIASYVQRNGFDLNIEIKPTPGTDERTGRLVALAVQRLWLGQARQPLLSSFQAEALRAAMRAAPGLPRALLLDRLSPDWHDLALDLQCRAVVTHFRLMDAAVIAQLHASGMRGLVYTVNDADEARRMLDLGVDALITDAVDLFSPTLTAPLSS